MNTANIEYSHNNKNNNHTHGIVQHGKIVEEMKNISKDRKYTIQVIHPTGKITQTTHVSGEEIKNNYHKIFGEYKHGFIVIEEGAEPKIIFVYTGIVSDNINRILKKTLH